jgi:CheY-like chemotaxis protein
MLSLKSNFLAGFTVLVIDDEPDGIHIVELLLTRYGARVIGAANGTMGVLTAQKEHPNLIISDISMPMMDGWKLMSALRNHERTKDIPVIALTAHALHGDRERVLAAGFHNYIAKPLKPRTFVYDLMNLLVDLPQFAALVKGE